MLIEKLGRHLRDEGFAATARRSLAYLLRLSTNAIYRSHVELVFESDLRAPIPESPASRLAVREFVRDDATAVQQFIRQHNVHADYGLKRFTYNISHGYRAVLATTLDGEIVGYGWLGDKTQSHPAQRLHGITLGPRELYVFDLFVAPPFRKSTMALEFLIRAQHLGRERNFDRVVSTILESNRRSIRLHHLAGFREIDRHRVHVLLSLVLLYGRNIVLRNSLWF
jgi:hypothetical protein